MVIFILAFLINKSWVYVPSDLVDNSEGLRGPLRRRFPNSGVPQRSTLGPLFSSLCVNDLSTHTNFNINLFADDTVLTMKDKSLLKLQATVNCELAIVDDWMKLNRLSLNYSKSTYFIVKSFSYNSKNIALDDFNVSIGQHKFTLQFIQNIWEY